MERIPLKLGDSVRIDHRPCFGLPQLFRQLPLHVPSAKRSFETDRYITYKSCPRNQRRIRNYSCQKSPKCIALGAFCFFLPGFFMVRCMPESSALFRDAPISSLICWRSDPAPRLFRCIQINRIANLRPCALSVATIILLS
jgi:hypothetical protein